MGQAFTGYCFKVKPGEKLQEHPKGQLHMAGLYIIKKQEEFFASASTRIPVCNEYRQLIQSVVFGWSV